MTVPIVSSCYMYYRIAGKLRGVLIFVIFVVELVVTKFSTHENKCYPDVRAAVRATMWVWSRTWPAGQLKDRSATTCQQRRKDVSLSLLPTS